MSVCSDLRASVAARAFTLMLITLLLIALVPDVVRAAEEFPDALPDAAIARGDGEIAAAWLGEPTDRYRHGILGDAIEGGALIVRLRDGREVRYRLPQEQVFEDRQVRLVELTRNPPVEMAVVVSDVEYGSALAVYGLVGGTIEMLARTPWIGRSNRWLNPVAIADMTGDGRIEIALVETPHIGGELQVWRMERNGSTLGGYAMRPVATLDGFSNHAIGSREQGLGLLLPAGDKGRRRLLLPENGRRSMALVAVTRGAVERVWRHDLDGEIDGPPVIDESAGSSDEGMRVVIPLRGGARQVLTLP